MTAVAQSVAAPDVAVIDHALGMTNAGGTIRSGGWEYVVLQQGPTPAGLDRDTLVLATRMLDSLVRSVGARTRSLMTWPSAAQRVRYPALFDETRETCLVVAVTVGVRCARAVDAWRAAWAVDPSLPLYGPDGYHPSPLGTYLTTLVLYEVITGHDASALPASPAPPGYPAGAVALVQRAAHATASGTGS